MEGEKMLTKLRGYFLNSWLNVQFVRWDREKKHWYVVDPLLWNITFSSGLLTDVRFVCQARGACLLRYSGKAGGILTRNVTEMPKGCVRQAPVKYDKDRHIFVSDGIEILEAKWLLLNKDGSAIAGWDQ